ncbi:hypothetical protein [Pseudoalteromonas sp.]|uniref:hypothetical protein n=1 Tax=Pseudoalteromonas sp. TaxID=53249 RepID=UPI00272B4F06|nr:hypothetical protein [Pseudoalteromonas sp.]
MKVVFKFIGLIGTISFFLVFVLFIYVGSGGEIPPSAQEYVIYFQTVLASFLTSNWFFVVFVAGWFGVCYGLGKESGWQNLAKRYRKNNDRVLEENFRIGSGYIGKIRHNGILKVAANNRGLYLRVLFPFKFGHNNLFISWQDISAVTLESGLFSENTPGLLKSMTKPFSKTEYLNIQLNEFPKQRLTIRSTEQLLSCIPKNFRDRAE